MLEKIIIEKSVLISYSQDELSNIATTSNHLRGIVKNQDDFNESILGGSYKRGTMVKGISDVDIYFQYVGTLGPTNALSRLKTCLTTAYPSTTIKQDRPSILVDFNRIPFNITPYRKDIWQNISIPTKTLHSWETVQFGELETAIINLRAKNQKYIDLIKILKLWNKNYSRGLKNFEIEWKVSNMFIYPGLYGNNLADWILNFFKINSYQTDANKLSHLIYTPYNEAQLKAGWLKFIDNK